MESLSGSSWFAFSAEIGVFSFSVFFSVQLLACFALEVSQNIRNGFIIVLVNNEHVFCVFIQHFSSSNYDFQVYWFGR